MTENLLFGGQANRLPHLTLALCFALLPVGPLAAQTPFPSPQAAAKALVSAAETNDTGALMKLFGPEGKPIVDSGDPAEDRALRLQFAKLAQEKLQVLERDSGHATLLAGNAEWPFPVPLALAKGEWRFDTAAGKTEVLARRIGRNEINAAEVCRGYVEAQIEYASADRDANGVLEYAQKILSSAGKKDGLYWEGESALVPKAFSDAAAAMEGHKSAPYHGYYFRILKAQGPGAEGGALDYVVKGKMIGGFALVAWPAEYAVSGIKTFLVNHKGIVYEKDLGASTAALARQMARFDPDKTWKPVTLE
ncbi:MAG: DUF2950 domain-containing protein [Bryobacteraceae bacterium]